MVSASFRSWTKFLLVAGLAFKVTGASAAIQFGGLTFDDNAFSDRVLSTDFTGILTGCTGYSPADIDAALSGNNLNTWIDYGYHDMEPGLDGDYNSAAPPYQYIELAFTDNVVVNTPGNDLAVFQIGTPNSVRVALDKNSIQSPYAPGATSVVADAQSLPTPYSNACIQVTVIYVDLSDLGVAEGDSVYRIFLTSPLMENGDVAWLSAAYPPLGVPELAGAAALHSAAKGNYAPEVGAGDDVIISLPANSVQLVGEVVDDGLPSDTLTTSWTQIAGPVAVLADSSSPVSQVAFPGAGTYSFQLNATDGQLASSDVVTVVVTAPDAIAPTMPQNFTAQTLSNTGVSLTWAASSDNVAVHHYNIYRNDVLLTTTTDLFYKDFMVDAATTYWYAVQAEDPAGNQSAQSGGEVVTLSQPLLAVQISNGADDAEEFVSGSIDVSGGDLELVEDGVRGAQHVGLRFRNVQLPAGAEIIKAWLEFTADETSADVTSLTIHGLAQDAPPVFSSATYNISSRPQTVAAAQWSGIPAWSEVGDRHQSADIAAVVQELVDQPNWQSGNVMGFVITGTGRRVAESYEATPTAAPRLFVEYVMGPPVNQAPMVNAGNDASLLLPNAELLLSGSISDDGLPSGNVSTLWEQIGGPATVVFSDSASLSSTATFPAAGVYELQLNVTDGELAASDTLMVSVYAPDTTAPGTPSGVSVSATHDGSATIIWAAASDDSGIQAYHIYRDGLEIAQTSLLNYQDSGLVSLNQYGYQIQAEDFSGNLSALSDTAYVTVPPVPAPGIVVSIRVATSADDVEEAADGRMDLASTDLELVDEFGMGNQRVGLRFVDVPVPAGATIVNAWLEFETDETGSGSTSLSIAAFADANPPAFNATAFNVSTRSTFGSVAWSPVPAWTTLDQKHQTPSITSLVQSVVNLPGWAEGNAMGFIVAGSGTRTAESYDGERLAAPTLFIEYREGLPVNQAPVVDAGGDAIVTLPENTASLSGNVTDDGISGALQLQWSLVSGPAAVSFSSAESAATDVIFSVGGTYVLQLLANDGEFEDADTLTVVVTEPDLVVPTQPQNLALEIAGVGAVALSWDASADNIGVQSYRVFRDGALVATVPGLGYTDTDLASDTYYVYQVAAVDLSGNESDLSGSMGITTPFVPETVTVLEVAVAAGNDDAEEASDGRVDLASTDLELVYEFGMGDQHVGLRFTGVQIPENAIITSAYLQFQADEPGASATTLSVMAINEANTPTFTTAAYNISSRNLSGNVQWPSLPTWVVDQNYTTPDIATLVQTIVNHSGWAAGNAMGFVITGSGARAAESYNGERLAAPRLHVEYYVGAPTNQPPVSSAGSDLVISLSSPVAVLSGAYSDDGLTPVTLEWSQTAGPAAALIAMPEGLSSEVSFSEAGLYTFSLRVDDGEFSVSDTVSVTVTAPDSQAPAVPTGLSATGHFDATVSLAWAATTDNVGVTAYRVYRDGVMISEQAGLSFTDVGRESEAYHEYQVTALDAAGNESLGSAVAAVTMPFIPEAVTVLEVAIATGNDDVEEAEDGRMDLGSTDLELVDETGMGNQRVGLRFTNVQLPAGAVITNAWLQFEADEPGATATSLTVSIFSSANAPAFTTTAFNLSSRTTLGSVAWNTLPSWTVDQDYQSPNLSGLIQSVVNSGAWAPGNALGFVISGNGTRTAESYNGERLAAPVLHIEYYEGEPVNLAPVVQAGADQIVSQPDATVSLDGSVLDDGQTSYLDIIWSVVSGPGSVTFSNEFAALTSASFTEAGVYQLQLLADDGEFTATDTLTVTVMAQDLEVPTAPAGVLAELQNNGNVVVSWLASADNTGVAGYMVYRDMVLLATVEGALTFTDVGLDVGSYDYVVVAYDFAGNQSSQSAPASVVVDSVVQSVSVAVSAGADDAEEQADGSIQLFSTDLEIVDEVGYSLQTVGVRFRGVQIPAGAQIVSAYITFEVDESSSGDAAIVITAEDSANPAVFTSAAYDISNRTTLVESVLWQIGGAWLENQRHDTADLSVLVQALVDRGDWVSGGAMSFIFSGSGTRTVESYNGEIQAAPVLHILYR